MSTDNEAAIKNTSWAIRLALVSGWSLLWAVVWFMWIGAMASDPAVAADDTALGMATCVATGCAGGAWFMGLCVAAVVYAIIRR